MNNWIPGAQGYPQLTRGRRATIWARLLAVLCALLSLSLITGVGLSPLSARGTIKPATAEDPQYIAAIELRNQAGLNAQEVSYLTEVMRQAAHHLPADRYPLITKENIFALLPPGTSIEDCQGECAVDTGRKIGATWLMTGEVILISGQLRLVIQLYHTPSNVMVKSEIVKGTASEPAKRVSQIENSLLASTMRLLTPIDPSLGAKASRVEGGFVFKRVEVEALPALPSGDLQSVEEAIKRVPRASQKIKSVSFQDVDVDALEAYQRAVQLEGSSAATAQERLKQWELVARNEKLASVAQPHVDKWRSFIEERRALQERRARAIGQLKELKRADAQADMKRYQAREAAWGKLKRLLKLDVIERADKLSWIEAYLDAYGAIDELNLHLDEEPLKAFLKEPGFAPTLQRLQAQSRATLKARQERAKEIERRLCELNEGQFWEGGACHQESLRQQCVAQKKAWRGARCVDTAESCARRRLVVKDGRCVKSAAQLKKEAADRAKLAEKEREERAQREAKRREAEAKKERQREALAARRASEELLLNSISDTQIFELSLQTQEGADRQNISVDMPGLLGSLGVNFNVTHTELETTASTLALRIGPADDDGEVGFGLHIPLGFSLSDQERLGLQEARWMSGYRDRWRWDAERFTFTLPVAFRSDDSSPWRLDLGFTPALATPGSSQQSWSQIEHPGHFEPYLQSEVGFRRLLSSGGSSLGLRYSAYYSPFSPTGQVHGVWLPQLLLRSGALGLKLEALLQTEGPSLAAFHELDELTMRAALWVNTDRVGESHGLCEATVIVGSIVGGLYLGYQSFTSMLEADDDDVQTMLQGSFGFTGSMIASPLLAIMAPDICE